MHAQVTRYDEADPNVSKEAALLGHVERGHHFGARALLKPDRRASSVVVEEEAPLRCLGESIGLEPTPHTLSAVAVTSQLCCC